MSHLNPGLISAYNSLTDKHLAGYFSNTRIRRHLQRAGLITRSGRIVPDKEYRHKLIQRAHQRHVRECLAQAIFHKVLEMERLHQIEIKRKLEEFARRERVHKIKVERSKRYEEDIIRILSPRPPTGARGIRKQHSGPEGEHSESSESPSSSRPNTAPGKMQRPIRLKPIHSNSTTASIRRSSPYRLLESSHENNQSFNCTMDKESRRRFPTAEASHGISPYCLPVINNFVTPVPPTTKRKERGVKVSRSSTVRGRRLRPTTASSGDVTEDPPLLRSSVHQSRVVVNMVYFGKSVHLSHEMTDMRDEVKVFQQHCGGENLCVFKGKLLEGEAFQFISRRHRGFPFSLTFFLNGLQVERLSSCCEFKHRKGSRLGGRHGHFGFSGIEGASPCYKCIIAMGLDKKPTPPPKRVRENVEREESVNSPKDAPEMEAERTGEDAASQSECETSQPQDMETQVEEETAPEEDRVRNDYEEDFEADDEAPAEDDVKEEKSPSPAIETEKQATEKEVSETEDDEKDEDIKSRSGSSSSGSDQEESDAEDTKGTNEEEKAERPKEVDPEEAAAPPDEKDEPNPEEAAVTEGESAVVKESDVQDSAGDSTEIDISDTSVPSGNENRQSDDTSGGKDAEKTIEENKPEEEQERAKSVQEKLAEAILKESQCSSEPELSDTSTEEDDSSDKGPKQDNKDAVPEKVVTFTDQPQTLVEPTKLEESETSEGEVAQEQEETSETKEQKDEEPQENSDDTKDEKVSEVEEDEKAAEEEKSEDAGESLHPVSEENAAQDDKTADPLEETPTEPPDVEAAEEDEGEEGKTDIQHDETGQGGKSGEEDESSVSEPNKKADETADNAEAEAMTASETMEMKAESSEEQEALSHEEAPVADTEERRQEDGEDGAAASETEVTAEDSSSSPEGSGDTIVEKTVETSTENTEEDDLKGVTEASQDDTPQERCEGEERMENSAEIDEKVEEQKSEKEEQTHIHPDKTEKDENTEERDEDETSRAEEEGKDESKADETIDKKDITAEGADSGTNIEGKQNEAEKTVVEEDTVANEEKVEEPEKTEKDETSECVENKNDELQSEEKGADTANEGEDRSETNTAVEDKNDEAGKSEHKAEQSETKEGENGDECEEKRDKTVGEEGEKSTITEELEKSEDADLDKDNGKKSPENVVESEDVGDGEAADGTKTTEEVLNDVKEAENVKREPERASNSSEKGGIDAENGEISTGAESKPREDEGDDLKAAENGEGVKQREEHTEDEIIDRKEVTVESEKDEAGEVDPDVNLVETEAQKEDESAEKQDELTKNESEPETSVVEIKEDPKLDDQTGIEKTEKDENGNKSDVGNENKESGLIEKINNVQNIINEVTVVAACSEDLEQTSAPVAVDLDDTAQHLDEQNKEPVAKFETEKDPHSDENPAGVSDVSAADVENGADTEEASKASEEGASVLLKPQAQNGEADKAEQSATLNKDIPEVLAKEDNSDLVTNWVNMHQTSKYFETFIEPLEDLREETSDAEGSKSNKEEMQSSELQRSESPGEMARMSEDEEQKLKDKTEPTDETKVEAVESDLDSIHAGDEPFEDVAVKDAPQVEKKIMPTTGTEQSDIESENRQDVRSEEHKENRGSIQEAQDAPMQGISEENGFSETKVESISGSHHSGVSGKPESVPENQTDEKTPENDPEMKDLQLCVKQEEHQDSKSPEGAKDIDETSEKPGEPSREVTEITNFTSSKSDDGSLEESHGGETQTKVSDGTLRRDIQLIQDIKHTLSKDRLSSFSVDETLFSPSSYPLLTPARTESGH
uniref:Glutamate rich 3 n=1 Tax=Acanthochromis polyacanthus TaxID=80966 RepID=A0A3Q1EQA9_9TELE